MLVLGARAFWAQPFCWVCVWGAPGASLAGGGTAVEARVKRAPGDRYSHVRVLPLPCVGPLWLLAYILLLPLGLPEVLTLA